MKNLELKFKIKAEGSEALDQALKRSKNNLADLNQETNKFGKSANFKKPGEELAKLDALSRGMGQSVSAAGIKTAAAFARLDKSTKQAVTGTKKLNAELEQTNRVSKKVVHQFAFLKTAAIGYFSITAVSNVSKSLVSTAAALQDNEVRLRRLSDTAADYNNNQQFLVKLSKQHNKELLALSDSYVKILALEKAEIVTRKEGRKILEGLSNAAAATGASNEQLKQSMFGLAQGLSAGTLRAEELNQVTEPLPGLLQELDKAAKGSAEGLDGTAGSFRRLVTAGKVSSDLFKRVLVDALASYDGAAAATSKNINAQFTHVRNSYTQLVAVLEDPINDALSPVLQAIAKEAEFLTGLLDNSLDAKIKQLQDRIKNFDAGGGASKFFADFFNYDINLEKNKLDSLIRQREKLKKTASTDKPKPKIGKPNKPAGSTGHTTKSDPGKAIVANLQRQIALYDETSNAAKFRYELEQGSLKNISEAQKTSIANYAEQLDALDAAKKEQAAYDDIVAEGVDLAKQQRKEMEAERTAQIDAITQVKDFLTQSQQTELEQLQAHYEARKQIILDSTVITEQEKAALLLELDQQAADEKLAFQQAQDMLLLSNASQTFSAMAELTGAFAGKQSAAYKAMFAVSKAFSIAETTIKTYKAAQDAYAAFSSIPYVGPALGAAAAAAAVAAGLARVASISGINIGGAAHGGLGHVPKESTYLLDRGERVLSPRQNTDLTTFLKNNTKSQSGSVNNSSSANSAYYITINVQAAAGDSAGQVGTKAGEAFIRSIAKQEIKTASRPGNILNPTTKYA